MQAVAFRDGIEDTFPFYVSHVVEIGAFPNRWVFGDWSFPPHYHSVFEWFVPMGVVGEIMVDGTTYRIDENDAYYLPPGSAHSFILRKGKGSKFIGLLVKYEPFSHLLDRLYSPNRLRLGERLARLPVVHRSLGPPLRDLFLRLSMTREVPSSSDEPRRTEPSFGADLEDIAIICRVFRMMLGAKIKTPAGSQRELPLIYTYLQDYFDKPFSLDELSARCGMSKWYVCRLFKKMSGTSIVQFLNQQRIHRAMFLMSECGSSVTDAALESGFENVSYFIRLFRRTTGQTPKKWVKRPAQRQGKG